MNFSALIPRRNLFCDFDRWVRFRTREAKEIYVCTRFDKTSFYDNSVQTIYTVFGARFFDQKSCDKKSKVQKSRNRHFMTPFFKTPFFGVQKKTQNCHVPRNQSLQLSRSLQFWHFISNLINLLLIQYKHNIAILWKTATGGRLCYEINEINEITQ